MVIGKWTFDYACSLRRRLLPPELRPQRPPQIALKAKSPRNDLEQSPNIKPGTIANNSCQNSQRPFVQPSPRPHHTYISTNISSSTLTNSITFPHIYSMDCHRPAQDPPQLTTQSHPSRARRRTPTRRSRRRSQEASTTGALPRDADAPFTRMS